MDSKIVNPSDGRSGGIMLLWKREVTIQQKYSAPKYIDVKVLDGKSGEWRFTSMYGELRWQDKYKTGYKIRELKAQHDLPWLIMGDLNEILYSHEKSGGNPRPTSYMQDFRDVLSDCSLEDLGVFGDPYTWQRGRIRERLDRTVASPSWSAMFPNAAPHHLDTDFDNMPAQPNHGPKRFEAKWLQESTFRDVVQKAWLAAGSDGPSGGVLERLGRVHEAMHEWDAKVLKKPKKRLRRSQREFYQAVSGALTDESEIKAKEMAELIEQILEHEEIEWIQRSRANWLKLEVGPTDPAFLDKIQQRVTPEMNQKL
ncbi:uncharacterized protein [Lolium perenne]|uniref:uncharacterized protein n=1 Tax=Lolium perenne TaxID=4522 RepID=UPI003A9A147C